MYVKPPCSTSTGHVVNVDLLSASIVTRFVLDTCLCSVAWKFCSELSIFLFLV